MKLDYQDFVSLEDISGKEIEDILKKTGKIKNKSTETENGVLENKDIGLLFEKPSTRTRISFEVGIRQLGGNCLFMRDEEIQLGRGETVADTSRTLSLYLNGIIARVNSHSKIEGLAERSEIPLINALSDFNHPCQAISDLFTLKELGKLGEKFVWVGDGNNVCNSLLHSLPKMGSEMVVCTPENFEPNEDILKKAKEYGKINVVNRPEKAVEDAEVIYTDQWVSMGDSEDKLKYFDGFQVNEELLSYASSSVVFMHCLPAKRGQEVTDQVIDGNKSIVWKQAENRLYSQKAILSLIYE